MSPSILERWSADWTETKKNSEHPDESRIREKTNLRQTALYEQLRHDILASGYPLGDSRSAQGLAVFLLKGMGAWMRAWSSCMPEVEDAAVSIPPECRPDTQLDLAPARSDRRSLEAAYIPAGVREQITTILTQIILGSNQSYGP